MARIFIEIVKDADPYPINEEDFNIAFANAPSLDDEKMKVDEEYWGGTDQDRIMRKMYALDYYATVDFPKDLQDELVEALTNEMGDEIELIITVEPGLPSPNWAYRAMDTDYTMREAEAAWLPKKSKSNPAKNPASTCTGCGKAISGAYEAGSYTCSGCGAGVEVNPVKYDEYGRSIPIKKKAKAQKPAVEGLTSEQVDKIDDILSFTSTVGELDIRLGMRRETSQVAKNDITAYTVVLDERVNMPILRIEVPVDAPTDAHMSAQMAGRELEWAIKKYLAQK